MNDDAIGSNAWRRKRRLELLEKTFDELEAYEHEIFDRYHELGRWASDYDYFSLGVVTDIFHWDYYDEFFKRYPKIMFSAIKPNYLGDGERQANPIATPRPKPAEPQAKHYYQPTLF